MGVCGGEGTRLRLGLAVASALLFAACAARQAQHPAPSTLVGDVSWYGPGFDGHRTASGEVYNQEDMTAASNIFPLGTRLMVTNLENRRSLEVRINDRGTLSRGRVLDLSHAAARVLG